MGRQADEPDEVILVIYCKGVSPYGKSNRLHRGMLRSRVVYEGSATMRLVFTNGKDKSETVLY